MKPFFLALGLFLHPVPLPDLSPAEIQASAPKTFAHTCPDVPCFKLVGSEKPLDCGVIAFDIVLALQAYDRQGPTSGAIMCKLVSGVTLHIRPEPRTWEIPHIGTVLGVWHPSTEYIEITRNMFALAHEMLHVYEAKNPFVVELGELVQGPNGPFGPWTENSVYMRMLTAYEGLCAGLD